MFFKNDYEIIKEKYIDSDFERAAKYLKSFSGVEIDTSSTYIIIYKCKNCNKIKESVFKTN